MDDSTYILAAGNDPLTIEVQGQQKFDGELDHFWDTIGMWKKWTASLPLCEQIDSFPAWYTLPPGNTISVAEWVGMKGTQ